MKGGSAPTQSELAGLDAQAPGGVQQRANIPTWSTLTYSDGGQVFAPYVGQTDHWRQSIDLRTGSHCDDRPDGPHLTAT